MGRERKKAKEDLSIINDKINKYSYLIEKNIMRQFQKL